MTEGRAIRTGAAVVAILDPGMMNLRDHVPSQEAATLNHGEGHSVSMSPTRIAGVAQGAQDFGAAQGAVVLSAAALPRGWRTTECGWGAPRAPTKGRLDRDQVMIMWVPLHRCLVHRIRSLALHCWGRA